MEDGSDLSVFLKMLLLPSRTVSWKARAAWWLSSTAVSLYRMASSLPALHKKELVRPGWSTSCTVAAIRAATSSSWSRLLWNGWKERSRQSDAFLRTIMRELGKKYFQKPILFLMKC